MEEQFSRTALLLGEEGMEKLFFARVAVFGLGGVGGSAVEALARAGVGTFDLCDNDTVSESNINRQLLALHNTVGMRKTEAAAARIHAINPAAKITLHDLFFLPETSGQFDFSAYDYVVDAIDTVSAKMELYRRAKEAGVPVISSMGTGNKLDPTAFRVTDISKTEVCPLARTLRNLCRKEGIRGIKAVWSPEEPVKVALPDENGRHPPASVPFLPPVAGYIIAGEVIKDLCGIGKQ